MLYLFGNDVEGYALTLEILEEFTGQRQAQLAGEMEFAAVLGRVEVDVDRHRLGLRTPVLAFLVVADIER